MTEKTFIEVFAELADTHSESVAIRTDNNAILYSELDTVSDHLAKGLVERGIEPGDRVATILPNWPEFVYCYLAVAKVGAVLVPLNYRYRSKELEYMISTCECSTVIAAREFDGVDYGNLLADVFEAEDSLQWISFVGDAEMEWATTFEGLLQAGEKSDIDLYRRTEAVDADDGLIVFYTSGTTGQPKPALSTHTTVVAACSGHIDHWDISDEDVGLMALPNNHVGGANVMVATCLMTGATIRLFETFDAGAILRSIETDRGTYTNGVPVMYSDLIHHDEFDRFDTSSFRLGIIGGSSPSPELVREATTKLDGKIVQGWGMSETSGYAVSTYPDDPPETHANSIGVPMAHCEAMVADVEDHTTEVPQGDVGELLVRGDSVFEEYLNMPGKTEANFTNGWFGTDDLMSENSDGYLKFVDRENNMFVSGGYNIYPREIENYIEARDGIDQACVVGVTDEHWGNVGWCFVTPQDDVTVSTEEIEHYCRDNFADYKIPKRFLVRDELPLTPASKIAREELRQEAERMKAEESQ